jgi:hypothetical protein
VGVFFPFWNCPLFTRHHSQVLSQFSSLPNLCPLRVSALSLSLSCLQPPNAGSVRRPPPTTSYVLLPLQLSTVDCQLAPL